MIYSHVFEKPLTAAETEHPQSNYSKPRRSMWIKATPVEGQSNAFKMDICRYDTFGYIGAALAYREISVAGVYTREQALTMIRAHEAAWLKGLMQPARSQPFKENIQTKLTP